MVVHAWADADGEGHEVYSVLDVETSVGRSYLRAYQKARPEPSAEGEAALLRDGWHYDPDRSGIERSPWC